MEWKASTSVNEGQSNDISKARPVLWQTDVVVTPQCLESFWRHLQVPALEPATADLAGFLDVLDVEDMIRNPVLPPFEDDGVGFLLPNPLMSQMGVERR